MVVTTYTPDKTRQGLLSSAYNEIWKNGFRAASLEAILSQTGVTKGALYHHFKNKSELGYAVVDEIVRQKVLESWVEPLARGKDPIEVLIQMPSRFSEEETADYCQYGCPLNNLAQEMSSIDEGFRLRIDAIYAEWLEAIASALTRGQEKGLVRDNINPQNTAIFIVALCEGAIGMAKNAQSKEILAPCFEALIHYLNALRPRCSFR